MTITVSDELRRLPKGQGRPKRDKEDPKRVLRQRATTEAIRNSLNNRATYRVLSSNSVNALHTLSRTLQSTNTNNQQVQYGSLIP